MGNKQFYYVKFYHHICLKALAPHKLVEETRICTYHESSVYTVHNRQNLTLNKSNLTSNSNHLAI